MIERYTNPEMGRIWTLQHEFEVMLEVEITACEAMAELGQIPVEAAKNIREKAQFNLERVKEIEKVTNHDIIAFLTNVAEYVGEDSKYIHKGLTSSDVKDTALGIMMKKSAELILEDLKNLRDVLKRQAQKYKHTVCIGRTHGIHAEPMTLGLKFALWYDEICRDIERVEHAKKVVAVGKLSGAVGTYSNIDPRIEEITCKKLGIEPVKLATQVIQRDRHAEYMTTLAIVASTFEKSLQNYAISNVQIFVKLKNISSLAKKALLLCLINAIQSLENASLVWLVLFVVTLLQLWKISLFGMNAIFPILPLNA